MRLTAITLQRYGNYESEQILFTPVPGRVNILLAPNSAGKSVLRNAVADLLFGIHNQTPMDFRFGYSGMRISADVVRPDLPQTTFSRRKSRSNVVTGADDQPLDPGFLHGMLAGRDRKLLERLFVLDTEGLRQGGADLLQSGGDVASALLAAAGGIRQARTLKQSLERKRDELAPERRTASRPFYQALDRFLEARRRTGAETLRPDTWFRQQQELEELEDRRRRHNTEAEAASVEIARLQRIRRVRRWLTQRTDAAAWLAANPDAPRLGPDIRQALEQARLDVAMKQEIAGLARDMLERAEQNADDVTINADLLANAEQIKHLVEEAGGARTARADLPGRQAECDVSLASLLDLLGQLGSHLPPERATEALPTRPLVARTRQRIKDHATIAAASQTATGRIAARTNDLAEVERRLAELPPIVDLGALEVLLEEIRATGDPATRRAETEAAVAECDAALAAALARIPAWSGDADALVALSPPAVDVWRRLDADMSTKRSAAATTGERLDDEAARLEQVRAALAELTEGGTIADDTALARARSHRDAGWQLIYRRAFTPDPPSAAEEQAFAAGVPLPLAFERAVGETDTIADRRAENSEVLGLVAAARRNVYEVEQRMEAARDRSRLAQEAFAQTRRVWAALCQSIGQDADAALADIQAFLNARIQAIDVLQRRAVAVHAIRSLVLRQQEWAAALGAALGQQPKDLPTLLAIAGQTLAQARQQHQIRHQLETLRAQATKELRDSVSAQRAAEDGLAAWQQRWRALLAELGRPETEEPAETEAVLQIHADIEKEQLRASSLSERIAGMNVVIDRFTCSVTALCLTLPGLTGALDPFDALRELDRQLDAERARDQRQRLLQAGLAEARVADAVAIQQLTAAQARLHAILTVIGADSIDLAIQRLALSDERAAYEAKHAEAEAELRQAGDGYSIEVLRADAAKTPVDEDTSRIETANTAHKQANEAAQRAAEDASRLRQSMEQIAGRTEVITAAADQQAAIASLSRTLDEALLYHTASVLLGRALDSVEQSGGSEMLRQLSGIFQTLTNGAYSNVTSDPDDSGKAELVMIQRNFPEERQRIEQLSEGTRDQLFLALRVAAIEDHVRTAEPLPFIGDDILQTFDDDRALAALRVLARLSEHTQVIVLTHHRHILELAARLPPDTVFECRRENLAAAV